MRPPRILAVALSLTFVPVFHSSFAGPATPLTSPSQIDSIISEADLMMQEWDRICYRVLVPSERVLALEQLLERVQAYSARYPKEATPFVIEGLVLQSIASAEGGFGALGRLNDARAKLEKSIQLDPKVMDGGALVTLGALYMKVPPRPLSFRDDDKAREYLLAALKIDPDGLESNFFYAQYLQKHSDASATDYFAKALASPPIANRVLANEAVRSDIRKILNKNQ